MSEENDRITPEKTLEAKRRYYHANREKMIETQRRYKAANREKMMVQKKKSELNKFSQKWDAVVERLKSSGADLSKIKIKREESRDYGSRRKD